MLGAKPSKKIDFAQQHVTTRFKAMRSGSKESNGLAGAGVERRNGRGNGRGKLGNNIFSRGSNLGAIAGEGENQALDQLELVVQAPWFGSQGARHGNHSQESGIKGGATENQPKVHMAPKVTHGSDDLHASTDGDPEVACQLLRGPRAGAQSMAL